MKTLFFIGFMGAGKTSVSAALGRMLQLPVMEMDDEIARREVGEGLQFFAVRGRFFWLRRSRRFFDEDLPFC